MTPSGGPRRAWTLSATALDRLLAWLDDDRERAGARYETLQRKLVKFFEWRGCTGTEDLADDTLDRTARKLIEGLQVRASDPMQYIYAVARLVALEALKKQRRFSDLDTHDDPPAPQREPADDEDERRATCLQHCLTALAPWQRDMLMAYYEGDGLHRIQNRQAVARRLAMPLNALRIRVHRLRESLAGCIRQCVLAAGPRTLAKRNAFAIRATTNRGSDGSKRS